MSHDPGFNWYEEDAKLFAKQRDRFAKERDEALAKLILARGSLERLLEILDALPDAAETARLVRQVLVLTA